ncbi:MAG: periplasmic heavy metal sensor [Gemmatimonadetes bacterium]|nr:periplasmic heavy metal sensor [Gemmatimonadota bacterium]
MFNRSKAWALGLLLAIGTAGFAGGAATMNYVGEQPKQVHRRCSYSGMLQRELNLTDAQRDSVRAIWRRHRGEFRAALAPVQPQLDSIRAGIRGELRAMMTPPQQVAFDRFLARERAERQRGDSAGARSEND